MAKLSRKAANILLLLSGVASIILGLWAFWDPQDTLLLFASLIGLAALVSGVLALAAYVGGERRWHRGWVLARGIIDMLIGVLLLWNVGITAAVLPWVMAFWAIFAAILYLSQALSMHSAGVKGWGMLLISALLAGIVGLLMLLIYPFGVFVVTFNIGFFLIFLGVSTLVAASSALSSSD